MGGSPGSTNVTQKPQIPDELKPLVGGSVGWTLGLQNNLPISQFAQPNPRGTADLSNLQQLGMNNVPDLFQPNPATLGQLNLMNSVVGGPVGSSPATQQAMEAWRNFTLPVVQNEASNMGLGRSGQELIATGLSASQALTPLLQQEISNRQANVPVMGGIADRTFNQQQAAINQALQSGQIGRDVAQQQLDSAFADFTRLQALSEASTLGPLGQVLPSLIGSQTNKSKDIFTGLMGK